MTNYADDNEDDDDDDSNYDHDNDDEVIVLLQVIMVEQPGIRRDPFTYRGTSEGKLHSLLPPCSEKDTNAGSEVNQQIIRNQEKLIMP